MLSKRGIKFSLADHDYTSCVAPFSLVCFIQDSNPDSFIGYLCALFYVEYVGLLVYFMLVIIAKFRQFNLHKAH